MTAVEARTGRASVNDALIPVRTPQRLVAALLLDYAVVLLCGLVGGFIGLAVGRLFDVDVPTSGMMHASIAAVAVHVYNRVLLVGRRGCSLGQDQAGILIVDPATGATVGPARAAVREVLSLPLRAAALAVVVMVLRFVGGVIDGALDGLLMVVAVAGASLLFCLVLWPQTFARVVHAAWAV
ncbi:MAG: RDD family protein, partial [Acidimicrobiaceae bacterium]|nr:RDD family protein [Acidimicrobiaceae bacterium]